MHVISNCEIFKFTLVELICFQTIAVKPSIDVSIPAEYKQQQCYQIGT